MRYGPLTLLLASALAAFITVAPASAHHAVGAKFDSNKPITLSGLVTKVDWLNPHAHVFINVQQGGNVADWAIELESPVDLQRSGWKTDTVKPGDLISVQGLAARDGSKQLWANSVSTGAGRRIFVLSAAQPRRDNRPTPRWPDGHPRLGPPPGERGYWGNPSAPVLVQTGANVQADADGILRNITDVDKVAPFQRWARDLLELRQRNFLKDDPMFLFCKPPGGPRQFQLRYGIQFVEELYRQRIWVLAKKCGACCERFVRPFGGCECVDQDGQNHLLFRRFGECFLISLRQRDFLGGISDAGDLIGDAASDTGPRRALRKFLNEI